MNLNKANKGLATPVSLLILLSSFILLTMATYYSAISSVNTKAGRLNYAAAKQDMLTLDNSIVSMVWSPGSALVQYFQGQGGRFEIKPEMRRLLINLTLGSSNDIIFNSTVGRIEYEMPSTDISDFGLFLSGDERAIINKSYTRMSQMYIANDEDSQVIHLGYRPLVTCFVDRSESNTTNVVRICLINLNSSKNLIFQGNFRIKVHCVNVTSETRNYNLPYQVSTAIVKASIDDDEGSVYLPTSSNVDSTLVKTQILICNIRLEEVNG